VTDFLAARDAAAEADDVVRTTSLGANAVARVLEPSPVLDDDPDWLADDPVNRPAPAGTTVVSPLAGADRRWADLVAEHPGLADFARDRWLADHRPLTSLPDHFASTRLDLHRVASLVVSPARRQAIGKMGLRFTLGGFGTPFFAAADGAPTQIRVVVVPGGVHLVRQRGSEAAHTRVETINQLAEFVGIEPDVEWVADNDIPEPGDLDRPLAIDPEAAGALADWYGFAWSILEELRAEEASIEASRPQLWPEHFDPAIEIGRAERQERASYGFSPGDVTKAAEPGPEPLPYVYVGPWFPDARPDSEFWNATGFPGALIRHADIVAAGASGAEQRAFVLDFLRKGRSLLLGHQ
jgi:hypothetical protein